MMKSSIKRGNDVECHGSKRRRLDKISKLPDELLVLILSFLPTWYAVRTSIISRRWRYLFTLADCLSFDDEPFLKHREIIMTGESACIKRFENFVYKFLELHQTSHIKKFSLVCQRGYYDKPHLNAWVKHAIQKGVQELDYQVNEEELPDDLVTCKTLVKLIVRGYCNIKIPVSSWLPNLKILHLHYIKFGDDSHSIERFLSSCECLEELTLNHCGLYNKGHVTISLRHLKMLKIIQCRVIGNGYFEIEAPNLAYLTYYSPAEVKIAPLWKSSCSLVKAELYLGYYEADCNILRDVAYKTTNLHLQSSSMEPLLKIGDMEQVHDFPCLSRLHFCYVSYDSWKYVTSVLDKSPQLETLVFESGLHCCYRLSPPPPNESLLPFSCHVKVIEVNNLCGHEGSLLLLGHLLRNARVLKKLIVRKCHGFDDTENALKISKDLFMLPKASSDCCIELIEFR